MHTIVIVGGGYAGIHTARAVREESGRLGAPVRIVLLDQYPFHQKKVRLVQAAAQPIPLRVPWDRLFAPGEDIEFVQGRFVGLDASARSIRYAAPEAEGAAERTLAYDRLVLALGSVVRGAPAGAAGVALRDEAHAERIRLRVEANVAAAAAEPDPRRRAAMLSVVVAGGGTSGVETAAELAKALPLRAAAFGLPAELPQVTLVTGGDRLVPLMSEAAARRLEAHLHRAGVRVMRGVRVALDEGDGSALLSDGRRIPAGLVVWTVGVDPNPAAAALGFPCDESGRLLTDGSYRVRSGCGTIYAIGDNARVVDAVSGIADGMTCREAIAQAHRLGRTLLADLTGRPAEPHRAATRRQSCLGLGGGEGFAWIRRWGIDITIGGKLGGKVREYTWNIASFDK